MNNFKSLTLNCLIELNEFLSILKTTLMKKNILLILFVLFVTSSYSQGCPSNSEYATYMVLNNGFIEDVEPSETVGPGYYITLNNILANNYTFTVNHTESGVGVVNDYITITDNSNGFLAEGISSLNHTFASGGTYRIHISDNNLCETSDLNVTVTLLNETVAPTTCQMPENPRVSYRSDTRIDFYWDPPSIGDTPVSYDWEAVPGGNPQGVGVVDSGNVTEPKVSVTGLTPSTSYTFYIRSKCGGNGDSDWFMTPFPLPTNAGPPPSNDVCSEAILIIQDTDKDVNTASIIDGTLLNTAQTDVTPENCDMMELDNARDDVWYSFIAQTNDINITLNPMFDGILELLSDCDEFSILDCSDAGNGTTEEQISYGSLVIGQTYYFRVFYQGFSTSSPDFTVKLWSPTMVADADGDGYSDPTDCDDGDAAINPSATEIVGNNVDEDCDGLYDRYQDSDGDTYGSTVVIQSANNSPGLGESNNSSDCDDTNDTVYPGAPELCDGLDNDCANGVDDGLTFLDYYTDSDGDGFGDSSAIAENSCSPVSGKVTDNTDCNDTDNTIYPGATEIPDDMIDQDCDGSDLTLGIDDFDLNAFSYYFNSDRNMLTINSFGEPFDNIKMYNLLGKLVMDKDLSGTTENINMSFLSEKFYIVRISIQNKVTDFKMIK